MGDGYRAAEASVPGNRLHLALQVLQVRGTQWWSSEHVAPELILGHPLVRPGHWAGSARGDAQLQPFFTSSMSLTRAALCSWLCGEHGEQHDEVLLFNAANYGGRGWLHDGPQAAGAHLRTARCVSLQPLRRGATKELRTAMDLLDAARSMSWLLKLPGNRGWMVSHGPEPSLHNCACTLVFCVCEPM